MKIDKTSLKIILVILFLFITAFNISAEENETDKKRISLEYELDPY